MPKWMFSSQFRLQRIVEDIFRLALEFKPFRVIPKYINMYIIFVL